MINKKRVNLGIGMCFLVVALFFTWQFAVRPRITNPEQDNQTSITEVASAETVYTELIGNLGSVINETEKEQVFTLIEKLLDVEKNGNDATEKKQSTRILLKSWTK